METVQFKMNIPVDVKQWVEDMAHITNRSQSAMIVTALRKAMLHDYDTVEKGSIQNAD